MTFSTTHPAMFSIRGKEGSFIGPVRTRFQHWAGLTATLLSRANEIKSWRTFSVPRRNRDLRAHQPSSPRTHAGCVQTGSPTNRFLRRNKIEQTWLTHARLHLCLHCSCERCLPLLNVLGEKFSDEVVVQKVRRSLLVQATDFAVICCRSSMFTLRRCFQPREPDVLPFLSTACLKGSPDAVQRSKWAGMACRVKQLSTDSLTDHYWLDCSIPVTAWFMIAETG